jgi:hypothetical protein
MAGSRGAVPGGDFEPYLPQRLRAMMCHDVDPAFRDVRETRSGLGEALIQAFAAPVARALVHLVRCPAGPPS